LEKGRFRSGVVFLESTVNSSVRASVNSVKNRLRKLFDKNGFRYGPPYGIVVVLSGGVEKRLEELSGEFDERVIFLCPLVNNSVAAVLESRVLREYDILIPPSMFRSFTQVLEFFSLRKRVKRFEWAFWLGGSEKVPQGVLEVMNVEVEEEKIEEIWKRFGNAKEEVDVVFKAYPTVEEDELYASVRLYNSLKEWFEKYDLVTANCFKFLDRGVTACFSAFLAEKFVCEGDLQVAVNWLIVENFGYKPFMANLTDFDGESASFAHCTVPKSIVDNVVLTTHYESGKSVGIKGELKGEDFVVFRIEFINRKVLLRKAKKIEKNWQSNACRTQIHLAFDKTFKPLNCSHYLIIPCFSSDKCSYLYSQLKLAIDILSFMTGEKYDMV